MIPRHHGNTTPTALRFAVTPATSEASENIRKTLSANSGSGTSFFYSPFHTIKTSCNECLASILIQRPPCVTYGPDHICLGFCNCFFFLPLLPWLRPHSWCSKEEEGEEETAPLFIPSFLLDCSLVCFYSQPFNAVWREY